MKVKGSAVLTIPLFISQRFGEDGQKRWFDSLPEDSKEVFSSPVLLSSWYPLKHALSAPTFKLCEMFYDGDLNGAWENGRFSAEYGLRGVYKIFIKIASPQFLIKKASSILPAYYDPCTIEASGTGKNGALVRITRFPEIDEVVENRMGGWIEQALEICGCRDVRMSRKKSLLNDDAYTEFQVSWRL